LIENRFAFLPAHFATLHYKQGKHKWCTAMLRGRTREKPTDPVAMFFCSYLVSICLGFGVGVALLVHSVHHEGSMADERLENATLRFFFLLTALFISFPGFLSWFLS